MNYLTSEEVQEGDVVSLIEGIANHPLHIAGAIGTAYPRDNNIDIEIGGFFASTKIENLKFLWRGSVFESQE